MASVNKVILVGTVGSEPEVHYLDRGVAVATLRLITDTEWHTVALWRNLAEWAEQCVHKGQTLYIEGKIQTRSWEKEGVMHYKTEIIADDAQLL